MKKSIVIIIVITVITLLSSCGSLEVLKMTQPRQPAVSVEPVEENNEPAEPAPSSVSVNSDSYAVSYDGRWYSAQVGSILVKAPSYDDLALMVQTVCNRFPNAV